MKTLQLTIVASVFFILFLPNFLKRPSYAGSTSYNPFYNGVGGPYSGDGGIGSGATLEEMLKLAREKVQTHLKTLILAQARHSLLVLHQNFSGQW